MMSDAPSGMRAPFVTTTRADGAIACTAGSMTARFVSVAPGHPEHKPAK